MLVAELVKMAALASAVYAVFILRRGSYQLEKERERTSWEKEFLEIYRDFWQDESNVAVRAMIANEQEYAKLAPTLKKRLGTDENLLEPHENGKIEDVDRFASILTRILLLKERKIDLTKHQEKIWDTMHFDFWIRKIKGRKELKKYLQTYWKGLLKE
jgi:hypothetical protein